MSGTFAAVKITDRVYWVGAIDWGLRDFHGYLTSRGSTYNAFLILAEKVTLIDTVKAPFYAEMMARIASVTDPRSIEVVISNHAEMDHSGSLPQLIAAAQPAEVIASPLGVKALARHFNWDVPVRPVSGGERLSLGNDELQFVEARMLHWPESMFSFLAGEGILFTNDGFGMHLASQERFADELESVDCYREAAKYYANILLPFSPIVQRLLGNLPSLNLDIRMIAPDHGPVWRENPGRILELYGQWAAQRRVAKAVIAYDTMWNSTAAMAQAIGEGLARGGLQVKTMPLKGSHRSDVVTELLDAGAFLVGSPTMNGQVLPPVADLMTYVRGLKPRNLAAAAFGSYGWGGEAVKRLEAVLEEMKAQVVADGLRVQYVPDQEALAQCRAFGEQVAARVKEHLAAVSGGDDAEV